MTIIDDFKANEQLHFSQSFAFSIRLLPYLTLHSFSSTSHSFCVVTLIRIIHFLESTASPSSKLYKDFSETIFSYSVFSSKFKLYRLHLCKMILRACSTDYFSFQAKHINRSMNANPITMTEYCCIAMNACFIFVPFLFN